MVTEANFLQLLKLNQNILKGKLFDSFHIHSRRKLIIRNA